MKKQFNRVKRIIFIFSIVLLFSFEHASADVIVQHVSESSGIVLDTPLDIELRDAIVEINANRGVVLGTFKIYSNEKKMYRARVYLKAKGFECGHRGCEKIDVASTFFTINNVSYDSFKDPNLHTQVYETSEGKFAGVEFDLLPQQVNIIQVHQRTNGPVTYYLDSLATFRKAEHEKITIYGDDIVVQFNDTYPVQKISEEEFVWEYYNINTKDPALQDKMIVRYRFLPQYNYTRSIIGIGILIFLGAIIFFFKRRWSKKNVSVFKQ